MPAPIRQQNTAVIDKLQQQPARFGFFQAVRLLERAAVFFNRKINSGSNAADDAVGSFTPPSNEVVHFDHQLTLGFPNHEVEKIRTTINPEGKRQWQLTTNFLGFTGSIGVLPFHYSELVFKRLKLKDEALHKFLNLFHHRSLSLFFQAGSKYRLPVAYERHTLLNKRKNELDQHTYTILSLIGMSTAHAGGDMAMAPQTLAYYSGLLSQKIRTQSALEQMLSHYFDIPVKLKEFVGQWHDLIDDVRSRLPTPCNPLGQNTQLGRSAILGNKGWFAQGKIQVVLGPLNEDQFKQFGPETSALKELNQMTKLFTGSEMEAEYIMHVAREHIPHRIQLNSHSAPIMGWDTWLATKPLAQDRKGEILEITVSSNQLGG